MDIYNLKPAWVQVVEDTKEELGRELTSEEINAIRQTTLGYANTLGSMYNRYLNLDGKHNKDMN